MEYETLERDGLVLLDRIGHHVDDPGSISRDVGRGLLVGLRRGAYVRRKVWEDSSPRAQHVFRVRAVVAAAQRPILIAGVSAAAVWGMPIAGDWPTDVLLLDERQGGGHREHGVRRTSVGFHSAEAACVDGVPVTSLARTALEVARRAGFTDAIGSLDWALWRKNPRAITAADLAAEVAKFEPHRGYLPLLRSSNFATSLSDSFGESETRAVVHVLGFEAPELQVPFRDAQGLIEPDFLWESIRTVFEFDGKQKYTRNQFTQGDPGEVVWREKKREDRLRLFDLRIRRILTEHVKRPQVLEQILLEAGVPRLHRPSGRR